LNASQLKLSPRLIQKALAERSLSNFIRLGWPNIDPNDYSANWHIDVMAEHLEAVTAGHIQRLVINIPPRHMKSIMVGVAWPAWTWAQLLSGALSGPHVQFLFASYAQTLSVRDSVKCRRLIDSPWFQSNWGDRFSLTGDQNTKVRFDNDHFGYRLATSVDGTLTGEGGSIIGVDDPHNANDVGSETVRFGTLDWWDTTMSTRLNNPKTGAYIVMMQRLHEGDLTGHVLETNAGEWVHLCLPARYEGDHPFVYSKDPRKDTEGALLWPDRVGETELAALERTMGSYGVAGQLQQRPSPRDGGLFNRLWFDVVAAPPAKAARVRRWDLAATEVGRGAADPDWTVGCLLSRSPEGTFYVEDVVRFRGSPELVERTVVAVAKADHETYGPGGVSIALSQDPGQAGKAQVQYLTKALAGYIVSSVSETGLKTTRAQPFASQAEAGNVKMVKAPWNKVFLDELELFPNGNHDDQADAVSGAFHALVGPGIKGESWLMLARAVNAGAKLTSSAGKPGRELTLAIGSTEWAAAYALLPPGSDKAITITVAE
jgi:predicted phage terminase large subunit-like protein